MAIVRHDASDCDVQYYPPHLQGLLLLLRFRRRGKSVVFLQGHIGTCLLVNQYVLFFGFLQKSLTQMLSLHVAIKDVLKMLREGQTVQMCACGMMTVLTPCAKEGWSFSCINQNLWETRLLSCSASASRRVLINSLSGGQMKFPPYIANVEGREIPQDLSPLHSPIGRGGEPRALAPIEGSSKKDWLSMDGREAWQSVPKEASLGRRRICRDVCENTGGSLFLTLFDSPSFNFWPAGESGGPKMITQKSPKWLFALPPRPALSSERKPLI